MKFLVQCFLEKTIQCGTESVFVELLLSRCNRCAIFIADILHKKSFSKAIFNSDFSAKDISKKYTLPTNVLSGHYFPNQYQWVHHLTSKQSKLINLNWIQYIFNIQQLDYNIRLRKYNKQFIFQNLKRIYFRFQSIICVLKCSFSYCLCSIRNRV